MRILFVRHGRTEENDKGILQGWNPGTLTQEGRQQGRKAASKLAREKIKAIYSSDLKRCMDTAQIIGEVLSLPVEAREELRERHLGAWTGQPSSVIGREEPPEDLESAEAQITRFKKLMQECHHQYPDDSIVCVGHSGLLAQLSKQQFDGAWIGQRTKNGGISTLTYDGKDITLENISLTEKS